jgi:hypothetical protein
MDQFDAYPPQNLVTYNGNSFYASHNTKLLDIAEASYVLDKSDKSGCTMVDLLSFCEQKTPASHHTNKEDSNHDEHSIRNNYQVTSFTSPSHDFCV